MRYTVEAGFRVSGWGFTLFFPTTLIESAMDVHLRWIRYGGVWIITRCAILQSKGYQLTHWALCLVILVVYGMVTRAIALICLFTSNRSRQKWSVRPSNELSPFLLLHSSHNFAIAYCTAASMSILTKNPEANYNILADHRHNFLLHFLVQNVPLDVP